MSQYQSFPDASGASRTFDKLKALRLPDLSGKSFLDVGCTEGFFCGVAHFQGASRVVGIDRSRHFIDNARRRFPDCEFLQRGWDALPPEQFDVVLLASALHYADDQAALIRALVDKLSPDGVLVLELGIVSSRKAVWKRVKRGIDERDFPSMPMLRKMLAGYAWKWMGPSVSQDGDPVARHVVHVGRRKPVAYLLMQPPGYGKSSLASGLFPKAGVAVVSGDQVIARVGKGKLRAAERLLAEIGRDYSPFRIDSITRAIFEEQLGADLVDLWLAVAGPGDVALDVYVPAGHHDTVERLLEARGYLPVRMHWERVGGAPLPEAVIEQQAEAYYLSMVAGDRPAKAAGEQRFSPAGCIDEIVVEAGGLLVRGWAVDAGGAVPGRIEARLGRTRLPVSSVEKQLRPDVQAHLGLPHALVGYRIRIEAPGIRGAELGRFKLQAQDGAAFAFAGPVAAIVREPDAP
jgi:ubiquinone/menaquinone biosynthesis C-methylase UbiE